MHGRERRAAPSEPAADGKPYSKKKLKPKKVRAADVLGPAQPSRRQDKVEAAEPAVVAAPAQECDGAPMSKKEARRKAREAAAAVAAEEAARAKAARDEAASAAVEAADRLRAALNAASDEQGSSSSEEEEEEEEEAGGAPCNAFSGLLLGGSDGDETSSGEEEGEEDGGAAVRAGGRVPAVAAAAPPQRDTTVEEALAEANAVAAKQEEAAAQRRARAVQAPEAAAGEEGARPPPWPVMAMEAVEAAARRGDGEGGGASLAWVKGYIAARWFSTTAATAAGRPLEEGCKVGQAAADDPGAVRPWNAGGPYRGKFETARRRRAVGVRGGDARLDKALAQAVLSEELLPPDRKGRYRLAQRPEREGTPEGRPATGDMRPLTAEEREEVRRQLRATLEERKASREGRV
ncbi:hypothetical protein EMIHUDRAFT_117970 [Emiliania huxleyi CCMP1516]|uniref:Uncharacterized protein n=2 Tax=Emiliania huxleyi TaxID=2903 RepID=A0A0D3J799_EMIH1|nr:hypothetical protein EMIHUDRAFT_117970 [Emiliania huxleyi CCMP1516]EOD19384.1 hypothetical protein EMIHUDRAFT_117970 [Emiliania huxleyi CCMP1516]|eukprot:XP_005771813.1 hypothetical protein EMIHUDRAFT_117970 [Emiliania huxleyi CCMP1516]